MYAADQQPDTEKVKLRLPRLGCFSLFFIVFFITIGAGVFLQRGISLDVPHFDIPAEKVSVSDPAEVLLEEDRENLQSLAEQIATDGSCSVAVMFVDEKNAAFNDLFYTIAKEWAPEKGVLLLFGLRNSDVRLELLGAGWRLADWMPDKVRRELSLLKPMQNGKKAGILLTRLLNSIHAVEKDNLPVKETESSTVLYSRVRSAESSGAPAFAVSIVLSALFLIFGWLILRNGEKTRAECLRRNPETEAEYQEKVKDNPEIRLVDLNRYAKEDRRTHRRKWKIAAIVLGLLFGLPGFAPNDSADLTKDAPAEEEPDFEKLLPGPGESRLVADRAGVFSAEDVRMLESVIRRMEKNTGGEMMVMTIKSLDGEVLEEFSLRVASALKIGKKGKDNGALLLFAMKERKNRLEIGYGWEGAVNDGRAGALLRSIVPEMRAGKTAEAAAKVVLGIEKYVVEAGEGAVAAVASAPEDAVPAKKTPPVRKVLVPVPTGNKSFGDPRRTDPSAPAWTLLGFVLCLIGFGMGYRGCVIRTSVPHLFIFDPAQVRISGGGSDDSDWGSSSSDSSSSDDDGGGGSFGGGGASGGW